MSLSDEIAPTPDDQLMLAFADGDANAFDTLYKRRENQILHFVQRLLGQRLAGEVDLAFRQTWGHIIDERRNFSPLDIWIVWALTIAHGRVLERLRRSGRDFGAAQAREAQAEADLDGLEAARLYGRRLQRDDGFGGGDEEQMAEVERVFWDAAGRRLLSCVEALPEDERVAFLLYQEELFTVQALAETLRLDDQTVRGLLRRGLKRLREGMETYLAVLGTGHGEDDEREEDELLRDPRLQRALAHAPDTGSVPEWETHNALLAQAHEGAGLDEAFERQSGSASLLAPRSLDGERSGHGLRWAVLVVLVAAVGGWFWLREPAPTVRVEQVTQEAVPPAPVAQIAPVAPVAASTPTPAPTPTTTPTPTPTPQAAATPPVANVAQAAAARSNAVPPTTRTPAAAAPATSLAAASPAPTPTAAAAPAAPAPAPSVPAPAARPEPPARVAAAAPPGSLPMLPGLPTLPMLPQAPVVPPALSSTLPSSTTAPSASAQAAPSAGSSRLVLAPIPTPDSVTTPPNGSTPAAPAASGKQARAAARQAASKPAADPAATDALAESALAPDASDAPVAPVARTRSRQRDAASAVAMLQVPATMGDEASAPVASAPPPRTAAPSNVRTDDTDPPTFDALSQWTRLTISRHGGPNRTVQRADAPDLISLLGSAAIAAVGPKPLVGVPDWRVTLERNGEVLAVLEVAATQVRWREGRTPPATGVPSGLALAGLRVALSEAMQDPAPSDAAPRSSAQPGSASPEAEATPAAPVAAQNP